jgi:hypothetical protein
VRRSADLSPVAVLDPVEYGGPRVARLQRRLRVLLNHQRHAEDGGGTEQQSDDDAGRGGQDEPFHSAKVAPSDNQTMSELFWRSESCVVMVGYTADGSLEFHGDDVRAFGTPGHGYEYFITVDAGQFAALRRALDVDDDADVLRAVVARVDDVMAVGESSWLERHGVEHRRNVWSSPPD